MIGGGVIGAGELLLGPARAEVAARALPPSRDLVEIVPAAFGVEAGMIGAAALAFDGLRATGAGGMSTGRLVVCPTPIGNLEDVTLRVLAALREADIVACEDTRRTRVLLDRYGVRGPPGQLSRAQRAPARGRARGADARRRRGRARVRRRHAARVRSRVRARAGVRRRRAGGRGAARAVGRARRAGGQRAPGRPVAVRRLPAAQARRARAGVLPRPRRWSRSSRPSASRRRCRCSPSSTRSGPWPCAAS